MVMNWKRQWGLETTLKIGAAVVAIIPGVGKQLGTIHAHRSDNLGITDYCIRYPKLVGPNGRPTMEIVWVTAGLVEPVVGRQNENINDG